MFVFVHRQPVFSCLAPHSCLLTGRSSDPAPRFGINAACDLAGDLHDVAVETQDDDLAAKADVRFGNLANLADAAVGPRCQELLKLAQAHAADLADAGTTAADLAEAQRLIDVYVKLVAAPRVATTGPTRS